MDIKLEKVYNTMEVFKEIHTSNSRHLDGDYYELLSSRNKPNEKYRSSFLEAKELILKKFLKRSSLRKYSFIIFSEESLILSSYDLSKGLPLNLKDYLSALESSKNYVEYLEKIKTNTFLYLAIFKLDLLNSICNEIVSDYIDDVMNIKEMEYKNKYLYSEPKDFQKIESLWKDGMYDNAIVGCRNTLLHFIDKYQQVHNGKRLNTEKVENSDKIDFSKNKEVFEEFLKKVCADYEIEELKKHLDIIIRNFGEIRNDFKGQPNLSLDDKEIETLYKKINTRMVIDLSKIVHNLLVVLVSEKVGK